MNMALVLPWFPIVLAVGVGGRLLDRPQGFGFGILGACFWILLVQAAVGTEVFTQLASILALAPGAAAIIAVGVWAGSMPTSADTATPRRVGSPLGPSSSASRAYASVGSALIRFEDWLDTYGESVDPWPDFGELLRVVLHDLSGATYIHPYRLTDENNCLVALRTVSPGEPAEACSARGSVVEHVVTTGRSYVAGDLPPVKARPDQVETSAGPIAWCFAIREGHQTIGLITVGHLVGPLGHDPRLLATAEGLVRRFWTTLDAVHRRRQAQTLDPASGLLAREPFLQQAEKLLAATYGRNEPVAVAVIALEGVRAMCDRGQWELADCLVREVADLLARRVRGDDLIGRFDGSRFVLLLRRTDSALGTLIVTQLGRRLQALCGNPQRWVEPVVVRCGLAASGTEAPELTELVCRAVQQCNRARQTQMTLCSDSSAIDDAASTEPVTSGVDS